MNTEENGKSVCYVCKKSYLKKKDLNKHIRAIHLKQTHTCEKCDKTFSYMGNLRRHQRTCSQSNAQINFHENKNNYKKADLTKREMDMHKNIPLKKTHKCEKCGKIFQHLRSLQRHQRTCSQNFSQMKSDTTFNNQQDSSISSENVQPDSPIPGTSHQSTTSFLNQSSFNLEKRDRFCCYCKQMFAYPSLLRRHLKSCNKIKKKPKSTTASQTSFRCRRCKEKFDNRHLLYIHYMKSHVNQAGGSLQSSPWRNDDLIFNDNEELREVYEANRTLILQNHQRGVVRSVYNFPITNNFTVNQIMERTQQMYEEQERVFRLNMEFGLILIHTETGQCRYFRPFSNEELFQRPVYVSRRRDLERLRTRLQNLNITDYILRQRPNTKWKPLMITNVRLLIYHLDFPLGCVVTKIPDYVRKSKAVITLEKNKKGELYEDNLCAFRCLSIHQGYRRDGLEKRSLFLFHTWKQYCHDDYEDDDFEGISLFDFPHFEACFNININAFHLQENGKAFPVYKSLNKYEATMNLNVHDSHLSYITDLSIYTKKFACLMCNKHFHIHSNLFRHQKNCKNITEYRYPGGFYQKPKTIFDRLEEYGIIIPQEKRIFKWFCVWDMEAVLAPIRDENTVKLKWVKEHIPISVSVCSNVEDFEEAYCIIQQDPQALVREMMMYMEKIRKKTHQLALEQFQEAFEQIDEYINEMDALQKDLKKETISKGEETIQNLREDLDSYCQQLICLGFNSQKYDMNLIKRYLGKEMNMHSSKKSFTVKRQNTYACLSNEYFKFLDITQYLAPGLNYSAFLKAFDVSESKGYFPYEWFDDIEKLNARELPPLPEWFSSLKNKNVLDDGTNTAEENYATVLKIWSRENMKTFRDYLTYYNNLDVAPFVQAVENLQKHYFERNIDIFKISISVPGLARYMLFECGRKAGACFSLIDKKNKDLYHTIKQNIIGGPSIVFHRHHEKNKTFIRGNVEKPCKTICGFDANALYLYCLGKPMPTGPFVRRQQENNFKPALRDKYMLSFYWMDYLIMNEGMEIQHKLNQGKEKRIGIYPVDGFNPKTNTVFQFHGCYFHGHSCWLTKNITNEKWIDNQEKNYKKTKETAAYIRSQGYDLVEKWECEFYEECRIDKDLKTYVVNRRLETPKTCLTTNQILEKVVNEELFGMVEVDIKVPEKWNKYFNHPTLSPYQYFSEMSPIFCTTDVPYEVIGDHMQEHLKKFDLSMKSRRLLVGGMKARKILLATPLLKWYIEHGLEVSKIYQTIEYKPQPCFETFVEDVSNARRLGDADPSKAIIADTRKLEGNSAYGSTIMDQQKFQEVSYVQGIGNAMQESNNPQFKRMCTLLEKEEFFEIEKAKKVLRLNMPVQIGYFILQYAKLHMLQFYYNFMDKYVDRSDFQYCEMDTDSAYMALGGESLESVIKPEMREQYHHFLNGSCDDSKYQADAENHWFPRTCCAKHSKYDKRTPGLFKLEYQGDNIISLCSKTYIISKTRTFKTSSAFITAQKLVQAAKKLKRKNIKLRSRTFQQIKFSSKGVSKCLIKAPLSIFKRVLKTQKPGYGINRGFRSRNNGIYSYEEQRNGFSYFYCKRKIESDGVTTSPLNLELCPIKNEESECEEMMEFE